MNFAEMLEKKMQTFTHSLWILLFSTSRFSASFCPILSGFRKQQLFLHMTSLNVEYSQHMVNVSTFFQVIHHVDLFFVIPRSMPLEHSLRKLSCKAWLFYIYIQFKARMMIPAHCIFQWGVLAIFFSVLGFSNTPCLVQGYKEISPFRKVSIIS